MNLKDNFLEIGLYLIEIINFNKIMIHFIKCKDLQGMIFNQVSKIFKISILDKTLGILIIKIKIFPVNTLLSKCNKTSRKQTKQI
jgi:hypothetical protein